MCSSYNERHTTAGGLIAEISRVRGSVLSFSGDSDALELPEPVGPTVSLSEKLTIPVKEHPEVSGDLDFNGHNNGLS